jgi:hypothetical protein
MRSEAALLRTSVGQLMRGKDYNAGLRGVLFEARHYERMGAAIWLYGWLVLRQTHQQGDIGWVLGGAPISYREIEEETGFNVRTLERWMRSLRQHGYIQTQAAPAGIIVRITKAKKYPQAGRKLAEGVRRIAGRSPEKCVASERYPLQKQYVAGVIGSSFIARSPERTTSADFHRDFHKNVRNQSPESETTNSKPSGLEQTQNQNRNRKNSPDADFPAGPHFQQQAKFFLEARLRRQLIRAEREEAVRRELAVGSGPEVPHS